MLSSIDTGTKKDVEIIDEIFLYLIDFSKKHILEESINNEISYEQFKVLFQLYGKEKVNMNEIGENICISNSACTILIDKLIKLELVERKRSDKDRRLVEVYITPKGKESLSNIIKKRYELVEDFLSSMTEQEQKIISQSILILSKNIQYFKDKR